MQEARVAAAELESALARIAGDLRTTGPAGAALLPELDALRAEAAPLLAAAPPAAAPLRREDPWAPADPADEAAEEATEQAWNRELDVVQRRAVATPAAAVDVPHAAAAGVAGPGERLPHLDAIQRAFGAHDVTGVVAHVGGPAAAAAETIGAEAYATGHHVAFAAPPSLFVAAHEAAHVVQQRAGVSLLGGVGQAGDPYEHHADAVAARVVAGQSAADLLGPVAAGGGGGGAVQRKDRLLREIDVDGSKPAKPNTTPDPVHRVATTADIDAGRQKRLDGWRPLIAAGRHAREGYAIVKSLAWDPGQAGRAGIEACRAVASDLEVVEPGEHSSATRSWFVDAIATATMLVAAVRDLHEVAGEAARLAAAIAALERHAPHDWDGAPSTEEGARRQAGKPKAWSEQEREVAPGQLRLAGADLAEALETYRQEMFGEDHPDGGGRTATSANKEPLLLAAAQASGGRIGYVLDAFARAEVSADDPGLRAAAEAYLAQARRFVSWAMGLDPVEAPARLLSEAGTRLARLLGFPDVEVKDPMPRRTDAATLDQAFGNLMSVWGFLFKRQQRVLTKLAVGSNEDPPWYRDLAIALGELCVTAGFAAITGGFGARVASGFDDVVMKATISASAKDTSKGLAEKLRKTMPRGSGITDVRKTFFEAQVSALDEVEAASAILLRSRVMPEAQHSPNGIEMIKQLQLMLEGDADQVELALRRSGVQAWADYLARAMHGVDEQSGGADLDRSGNVRHETSAEYPMGILRIRIRLPSDLDRPTMGGAATAATRGSELQILSASAPGLADSDRAVLEGIRVADLRMPLQVIGVLGDEEVLHASSNGKGAFWLNDAGVVAEGWLLERGYGAGAAALPGLFAEVGRLHVPRVEE
jgi:hypothetical protein